MTISLAEYDCMAVAVSFAAVSKHGISNYSPEHTYGVNVIIDGGKLARQASHVLFQLVVAFKTAYLMLSNCVKYTEVH